MIRRWRNAERTIGVSAKIVMRAWRTLQTGAHFDTALVKQPLRDLSGRKPVVGKREQFALARNIRGAQQLNAFYFLNFIHTVEKFLPCMLRYWWMLQGCEQSCDADHIGRAGLKTVRHIIGHIV